jgi:hypothetical protein
MPGGPEPGGGNRRILRKRDNLPLQEGLRSDPQSHPRRSVQGQGGIPLRRLVDPQSPGGSGLCPEQGRSDGVRSPGGSWRTSRSRWSRAGCLTSSLAISPGPGSTPQLGQTARQRWSGNRWALAPCRFIPPTVRTSTRKRQWLWVRTMTTPCQTRAPPRRLWAATPDEEHVSRDSTGPWKGQLVWSPGTMPRTG